LEDRIVKRFLRAASREDPAWAGMPAVPPEARPATAAPETETPAELETTRASPSTRRTVGIPTALTLLGLAVVLIRLGSHPGFAYNWETYTAWRFFPFWDSPSGLIFDLTDGLMTDSGFSPLVALPAWVGFTIGGVGLTSLRVPIALIAAVAVPLTWLVGRRIAGSSTPVMAAILLALSPAFLIYARSATVVGISLAPALLTIYALIRVLQNPRSWRWLAVLAAMLILNSYAYAVIRFLWPIALVLLAGEVLWRRGARRWFLVALGMTAATLPAALVVFDHHPDYDPRAAIQRYFNGRGEQVLALRDYPEGYQYYLEPTEEELAGDGLAGSTTDLALRLIERNARDLGKLLLDHDTASALTDFWNPRGRLLPWFLVPFFALGTVASLWRMRRRVEDRALQGLFWGLSLPLLLTSQVHIGRLIFAIPLLCILIASGVVLASAWLSRVSRRVSPRLDARLLHTSVAIAVVLAAAFAGWRDYRAAPGATHDAHGIARLAADAALPRDTGRDAAYVRGGGDQTEVESITVAGYRLDLDGHYQFVDLNAGETPDRDDPRPVLYSGGLLDRIQTPNGIPMHCTAVYYVEFFALDRFNELAGDALPGCAEPPSVVPLED
ncbi:MAG: glycosyltransferase family 39 protein, partial [Thermomicrobiales bacterium]